MKDTNTKGPGMRRVGAAARNLATRSADIRQLDNGNRDNIAADMDYIGLGEKIHDYSNSQNRKDLTLLRKFAKSRYPDDEDAAWALLQRLIRAAVDNVENVDTTEGYDYTTNAEEWKPDNNIVDTLSDMKGV